MDAYAQVSLARRGAAALQALDERMAGAVETITTALCEHQDVLPARESAIALKRLEGVLTALEAVFENAEWLCDGEACRRLREDVRGYRETLE